MLQDKEVTQKTCVQPTWGWRTVLDMFTGKFLWDVSSTYRDQQKTESVS